MRASAKSRRREHAAQCTCTSRARARAARQPGRGRGRRQSAAAHQPACARCGPIPRSSTPEVTSVAPPDAKIPRTYPLKAAPGSQKPGRRAGGAWQRVPSNQRAASWRVLRGRHAARCRRCSPSHPTLPRCHSADLRKRARCGLASREWSVLCLARTRVESDSMHGFRERRTRNHITGRPGARRKRGPCLRCLSGPPLDGGRRLRCGARRRRSARGGGGARRSDAWPHLLFCMGRARNRGKNIKNETLPEGKSSI